MGCYHSRCGGTHRSGQQPGSRGDQARPSGSHGHRGRGPHRLVAEGDHGLARIDAATNRLLRPVVLEVQANRVATDGGTIWVAGPMTDPSLEPAGVSLRSKPRPAVCARSSQAACRLAWRPAWELSGSPSGTLLEGRWSASGRARAPQAGPGGCLPSGNWPLVAAPFGLPTAAGRWCTDSIPTACCALPPRY